MKALAEPSCLTSGAQPLCSAAAAQRCALPTLQHAGRLLVLPGWVKSPLSSLDVICAGRAGGQTSTKSPETPRGCRAWAETTQLLHPEVSHTVQGHRCLPLLSGSGKVPLPVSLVLLSFLVLQSLRPSSIPDPYLGSSWGWPKPERRQCRHSQAVHHHLVHLGVLNHHQLD